MILSESIFTSGDRLKMRGIAADSVSACMVELQSRWNSAVVFMFPDHAMNDSRFVSGAALCPAIAVAVELSCPFPASAVWVDADSAHESG